MKIYEIEKIKCYEVTEPDGVGFASNHIAYFSTKSAAEEYVRLSDKGWPKNIYEKFISNRYVVLDSAEEVGILEAENLRKSALSKLTEKEKAALGLL